jgi:hypothetical protein
MVNLRVAERQDVKNLPRRSFTVLKRSCNYQNGGSPMITLLQRMCWNRDCWRKPSGQGTDGGYPGESGFGHEEWNFQLEDACEGEVYGYLYYRPPQQTLNLSGGRFQIAFWALHPDLRQKLLVGFYHDAIPASRPDLEKLDRYFKKRRIYERRSAELVAAVPDLTFKQAMQHLHRAPEPPGSGARLQGVYPLTTTRAHVKPPAFKPFEAFAQLSPPAHLVLPNSPPPNAAANRTPATQYQPDPAPRSRYRPASLYYTNGNAALLGTLRRHLQFPRLQIVAPKNQARG